MNWLRIILLLICVLPAGAAPLLTRGPYLQLQTSNSMILRWRTDRDTKGLVRYGVTPESATNIARHAGSLREHIVRIDALQPDTRYFYAIGQETNAWFNVPGDTYAFRTAPAPGPPHPTRVWVIGDSGTADTNQFAVRDAFYRFSDGRQPDLWLMLGDNAYGSGTDAQYQKGVFDPYAWLLRQSPLWPTLGNHDAGSANSPTQSGVYYDVFTLPTQAQAGGMASGTEAYYSFDFANIHFICLDSHDTDRRPDGAMARWLRLDLENAARDWIICFFHHPPYTKGSHDSDKLADSAGRLVEMREYIMPILEAGGVDLVLAGHSHAYERSYLIDGAYGYSTNMTATHFKNHGSGRADADGAYEKASGSPPHEGAVYVVAGSSGKTCGGPLNHPAMYVSLNKLGSFILDVDGPTLNATFINEKGQVRDYFTLRKR